MHFFNPVNRMPLVEVIPGPATSPQTISSICELVRRIGITNVEWLEGPHEPQKYTVEELKALTAKYRALTRELKRAAA